MKKKIHKIYIAFIFTDNMIPNRTRYNIMFSEKLFNKNFNFEDQLKKPI